MDAYFTDLYGSRWSSLKSSLQSPVNHVALENAFAFGEDRSGERRLACVRGGLGEGTSSFKVKSVRVHSYSLRKQQVAKEEEEEDILAKSAYPVPREDAAGIKAWYWMDLASLFPPLALRVREGDSVLDLCAAPGGKSIVLAQQLFEGTKIDPPSPSAGSTLVCNEVNASRRTRLARVVAEYFPKHLRAKSRVRVSSSDGTKLRDLGAYDKILVDAPCSSERHVLMHHRQHSRGGPSRSKPSTSQSGAIERWSPKNCRGFAKLQFSILKSALPCLKPGGQLVYSTCSIASVENDGVIEKILEKFKSGRCQVRVVGDCGFGEAKDRRTLEQLGCEPTDHGYLMLPDRSNFGPIYWCVLQRI